MENFDNGMQFYKEKNYTEALKCFKQAVDNNINTEDCRNRMGEIYESITKFDQAYEMYHRNIKLKNDAESYFRITNLLMNQDKVEQATFFINQATQLHPHTASLFYIKGLLQQSKLHQHEEAVQNFDKCLQKDPQYKEAILKKIESLFEIKDYKAIIEAYSKYLKLDSQNIEVYKKIGNVYVLQQQYKNAIESYLQCIQMDPNFAEAYHNLGSVYQILHQYDSAIQIFDQCISVMLKTAKNQAIGQGNQDQHNRLGIGGLTKKKRRMMIMQRRKTHEQIMVNLVSQRKFEELLLFLDKLLLPWKDLLNKSSEYVQERKKSIAFKAKHKINNPSGISLRFEQIMFLQLSKAKCLKELQRYEESLAALKVCEDAEQYVNECLLLKSKLLILSKVNMNSYSDNEGQSEDKISENNWQEVQRKEAIKCLQQLLERDSTDWKALLQLGEIYEIEKEIPKQISIYKFILEHDTYNEEAIMKLVNLSKKGFTIDNVHELRGRLNSDKHSQYEHAIYAFLQADSFLENTEITDSVARLFNEGIKFYQQNKFQVQNATSFLKLFYYFCRLYKLSVEQFTLFNDSTSPQLMAIFAKALQKDNQIMKAIEIIDFISKEYSTPIQQPNQIASQSQAQDHSNQPHQVGTSSNLQLPQIQVGSKLSVPNAQSLINNNQASSSQQANNVQATSQQNLVSKIEGSKLQSSQYSQSVSSNSSLSNSTNIAFKLQFKKIQHVLLMIQGQCYEKLQMFEKALICYSESVRISPRFYLIYFYRGVLYYKMGLLGDALKNAEKSIQLNSFHADSHFLIAKIYQKQQKKAEYLQSLQKGLKLLSNSISLTHISDEDDADFLLADSGKIEELNYDNNKDNIDEDEEDEQEFDFFIQQKIRKLQKSNMTSQSMSERSQSHLQEGIHSYEANCLEDSKFHLENSLTDVFQKEQKSLTQTPLLFLCNDVQFLQDTRFAAHFYLNQIYLKKILSPVSAQSHRNLASEKSIQNTDEKQNINFDKQLESSPFKLGYLINKALLYLSYNQDNLAIDIFFDQLFPAYLSQEEIQDESAEAVIFTAATHLVAPMYNLGMNEKLIKLCEYISEFKKKIKKKQNTVPQHISEKLQSTEYLIIISIANFRMEKYEDSISCLQQLLQLHLDPSQAANSSSNKFQSRWNGYVKLTHFFLSLNFFKQNNIVQCLNHLQIYLKETSDNLSKQIQSAQSLSSSQTSSQESVLQNLQQECSYTLMVDLMIQNKQSSEIPILCEAILESLYEYVKQHYLPSILSLPKQGYLSLSQHALTKSLKCIITSKIKPQFEGSLRIFFPLMNDENADFAGKMFDFYEYSYFDRQSNLNSHLLVKLEGGTISQIVNPISGKRLVLSEQRCEIVKIKSVLEQREMLYRLVLNHRCLLKVHFFMKQGKDIYSIQDLSSHSLNQNAQSSKTSFSNLNSTSQLKNEVHNQGQGNSKIQEVTFANGSNFQNSNISNVNSNNNNNNNNSKRLESLALVAGEESKAQNHQVLQLITAIIHIVDCMQYLHRLEVYSANFLIENIIITDSNIPVITLFDNFTSSFSSSPHLNVQQLIQVIKTLFPICKQTPEQLQDLINKGQLISNSPASLSNLLIYLYKFLIKYNNTTILSQTKHQIAPSDFDVHSLFLQELSQILHQIAVSSILFSSQSTYKSIDTFYNNYIQGILQLNKLSNCKGVLPLMNTEEKDLLAQLQQSREYLNVEYNQFFYQLQMSVELPFLLQNDIVYTGINKFVQLGQLDIIQKQELLNELYSIRLQNSAKQSMVKIENRSRSVMSTINASDGRDEFILSLVSNLEPLMAIQDDIDSRDQNQLFSYLISLIKNPLKDDFFQRFVQRQKVYYEWKYEQQQDILKRIVRELYGEEELRQEKYEKFVRVLADYQIRTKNDSITQQEHEKLLAKAAAATSGGRKNKREEDGTLLDDVDCVVEQTTSANSFSISYYAQQKDNRANINVMSVFSHKPQLESNPDEDEIIFWHFNEQNNDLQIINETAEENTSEVIQVNYKLQEDGVIPFKIQESQALKSDRDSKEVTLALSSSQFKPSNSNNINQQQQQTSTFLKEANVTESLEYSQQYHSKHVQEMNIFLNKNQNDKQE